MAPFLSTRDLEIVQHAFQCFTSPDALKLDYDKLAQLAGFSNGRSANSSWLVIKKKLVNAPPEGNAVEGEDASSAKAKGTPKKRAPKAKANVNADAPADNEGTPTNSSVKKVGGKRKAAAMEADNADANVVDSIEEPAPKSKRKSTPRKPKDPNAPPAKRAKKGAKAGAESPTKGTNAEVKAETKEDEEEQSSVVNQIIKDEQDDENRPFTEEEQAYVNERLAGDGLFDGHTSAESVAV